MKVLIPIFCLCLCAQIASAQILDDKLDFSKRTDKGAFKSLNEADTAKWKYGITSSLTVNQTQVNNWQAGGNNNIGGNAVLGAYLDYRYKKHYWLTLLDASYGINRIQGQVTQKIQDYLEINTKYGYALSDKWSLTVFGEGISQFTPGFDYKADPQAIKPISRFLAPAFFTEGLGLVWEEKSLGLYTRIAPITARQILVNDARIDETRFGLDTGQNINNQFGASCRVDYLRLLVDKKQFKLTAESRLSLFTDYADVQSMVVNWRSKLTMNVAKVFSISVLFHTIYDPNVRFQETFTDANGVSQTRERQKIQVLQNIGFGVGYTFNRKKGRNA